MIERWAFKYGISSSYNNLAAARAYRGARELVLSAILPRQAAADLCLVSKIKASETYLRLARAPLLEVLVKRSRPLRYYNDLQLLALEADSYR